MCESVVLAMCETTLSHMTLSHMSNQYARKCNFNCAKLHFCARYVPSISCDRKFCSSSSNKQTPISLTIHHFHIKYETYTNFLNLFNKNTQIQNTNQLKCKYQRKVCSVVLVVNRLLSINFSVDSSPQLYHHQPVEKPTCATVYAAAYVHRPRVSG